jgi:ABC-type branched-subunit amino acid transport system substrate-binding protein
MAYDATMLVARAIAERGPRRDAVRDWLATLAGRGGYVGVTGAIRFQPSGDPLGRGVVMTRIHNGALLVAARPQ